jgi:nucleotide-binding universal stress UspA family protein
MTSKQSVGYHSIVAALTPSAANQPAVIRAVNVAAKLNSEVTLANVITTKQDSVSEQTSADIINQLTIGHAEITGAKSAQGDWLELINLANQVSGDLIVLDDKVYSELAPILIKSSKESCDHGDCDALIVHSQRYSSDMPPRDYQHIVVAADLNDQGLMTIYKAVRTAKRFQSRLSLLNVVELFDPDTGENEETIKKLRLRGLDAFTAVIEGIEIEKEVLVTKASVGQAVCDFATEHNADLVVIGSHKFKGLCVLHGKKAQQVIKGSTCDVLVVHE